jgi:hypothetical protein
MTYRLGAAGDDSDCCRAKLRRPPPRIALPSRGRLGAACATTQRHFSDLAADICWSPVLKTGAQWKAEPREPAPRRPRPSRADLRGLRVVRADIMNDPADSPRLLILGCIGARRSITPASRALGPSAVLAEHVVVGQPWAVGTVPW